MFELKIEISGIKGSGKTTIAHAIANFLTKQGAIISLKDGYFDEETSFREIRDTDLSSLKVEMVTHEP